MRLLRRAGPLPPTLYLSGVSALVEAAGHGEDEMSEMLVSAAFKAPLVCVIEADPTVLHAVTMEGVIKAWPDGPGVAACGVEDIKLLPVNGASVPWPPRVAGLPTGVTRCRSCHEATGKKRPRSEIRRAS